MSAPGKRDLQGLHYRTCLSQKMRNTFVVCVSREITTLTALWIYPKRQSTKKTQLHVGCAHNQQMLVWELPCEAFLSAGCSECTSGDFEDVTVITHNYYVIKTLPQRKISVSMAPHGRKPAAAGAQDVITSLSIFHFLCTKLISIRSPGWVGNFSRFTSFNFSSRRQWGFVMRG